MKTIDIAKGMYHLQGITAEEASTGFNPTGHKTSVHRICNIDFYLSDIKLPHELNILKASLTRPNGDQAPVTCSCIHVNTLNLTFMSCNAGKHVITVLKGGHHAVGSPFTVILEGDIFVNYESTEWNPNLGLICDIDLHVPHANIPADLKDIEVTLTGPDGEEEPVVLSCSVINALGSTFITNQLGKHIIDVTKGEEEVQGSPFVVMVNESFHNDTYSAPTCHCDFQILNLSNDLEIVKAIVTTPNGEEVPILCAYTSDSKLLLQYIPKRSGNSMHDNSKVSHPMRRTQGLTFVDIPVERVSIETKATVESNILNVKMLEDLKVLKNILTTSAVEGIPKVHSTMKDIPEVYSTEEELPEVYSAVEGLPEKQDSNFPNDGYAVQGSPFDGMNNQHTFDVALPNISAETDLVNIMKDVQCNLLPTTTTECSFLKRSDPIACIPTLVDKYNYNVPSINMSYGSGTTTTILPNMSELKYVPNEPGRGMDDVTHRLQGIHVDSIFQEDNKLDINCKESKVLCNFDCDVAAIKLPNDLNILNEFLTTSDREYETLVCSYTSDNSLSLTFTSDEPGNHIINVTKDGRQVEGSPFTVIIVEDTFTQEFNSTGGKHINVTFSIPDIDLPEDLELLSAILKRPNWNMRRIECSGMPKLSNIPNAPGKQLVNVEKKGCHTHANRFGITIEEIIFDQDDCTERIHTVGRMCNFSVNIVDVNLLDDLAILIATLISPSGAEKTLECTCTTDNYFNVTFTPVEQGEHEIKVTKGGLSVQGSPFTVMVNEYLHDSTEGVHSTGRKCSIDYGIGGGYLSDNLEIVDATLERHNDEEGDIVQHSFTSDNDIGLSFYSSELRNHLVNVTIEGYPAQEKPFVVLGSVVETKGNSVIGKQCNVYVDIFNADLQVDLLHLETILIRPDGKEESAECRYSPDNYLSIRFSYEEEGKHMIQISQDGCHIGCSPFAVVIGEVISQDEGSI